MYVEVDLLIEIGSQPEHVAASAYAGDSGLCALLHHIPKLSGELELSRTLERRNFYLKRITANAGPCKPVDHSGLRLRIGCFIGIFGNAKVFVKLGMAELYTLFAYGNIACSLSAYGSNGSIKRSDSCLTGVALDYLPDDINGEGQHALSEPVFLKLLGDQMARGDLHLFGCKISWHLNYFHPVKEGTGNT